MAKFGIGQPVRRLEDQRLVTGQGRYTDDINLPGQAYLVVVRSPHAHATIKSVNTAAAKKAPGVLGVFVAADLDAVGDNAIPCFIPMTNRDGSQAPMPKHPLLVADKARYVGDNIAFVVAETKAQARDAAELVEVDYDVLDAVVDTATALEPGKPVVHAECPNNIAYDYFHGDDKATEAAFAKAAHVTRLELINNRLVCNPMEPRASVAEFDKASGRVTVHTCTQGPWSFRDTIANNLGLEKDKVRVITADVGGGFGMKAMFYPEYTMTAFAARALGRPVKWTSERSEGFLSDSQGRDHVTTAELAMDKDHRILGLRIHITASMGAYYYLFAPFIPTGAALKVAPGVYDVPAMSFAVKGVFTNTVPVDAYRGAGRPESIYCMERLIEQAAREVGVPVTELRRINFVKPAQMPYKTAAGETYDSGEFDKVMSACLAKSDWNGIAKRKAEAKARGKLRGIGMCYYIESTMGDPTEHAGIRFEDDGWVSILVGTQTNGQGHETAYAQILHTRLGVPFERIRLVQGDTDKVKSGGGTGGSRSLTAEWMAINDASDTVVKKGKAYAAQVFETAAADIAFEDGSFRVAGTDKVIGIMDLAAKARTMSVPGFEGGLDADATISVKDWTFPNGCHIAEVEVDPDTGRTSIVGYNIVDDFGVILNPMLVEGQVHGGVVQGIGQALLEHTVYDDSGQLLTGSFMDYCMPRADDMPSFNFSTMEIPCKNNVMGVKGCGEAGSVGSPAAVINAIIDALEPYGVKAVDMPATPQRVWELIHAKKAA
ncbi:MAG: xanthine dehydrogenase family protein molybdopterin-binding subunit [Geminicoccaceae bacterium]